MVTLLSHLTVSHHKFPWGWSSGYEGEKDEAMLQHAHERTFLYKEIP